LQPTTLALVVYDMQVGILSQIANSERVLANVLRVLAAARERRGADGVPAPLLDAHRIGGRLSAASGQGVAAKAHASQTRPLIPHGAPGFELTPALEPRPSEAVIDKITMSAFEGTPLDIVLRDCGVRAYLIVGVALEVGIEPTVRHSTDLGYIPIVVRDACGAGDAAAGERALEALMFASDAIVADTNAVTASLIGATPKGRMSRTDDCGSRGRPWATVDGIRTAQPATLAVPAMEESGARGESVAPFGPVIAGRSWMRRECRGGPIPYERSRSK
jgi:nicotinamidase-related amidase